MDTAYELDAITERMLLLYTHFPSIVEIFAISFTSKKCNCSNSKKLYRHYAKIYIYISSYLKESHPTLKPYTIKSLLLDTHFK